MDTLLVLLTTFLSETTGVMPDYQRSYEYAVEQVKVANEEFGMNMTVIKVDESGSGGLSAEKTKNGCAIKFNEGGWSQWKTLLKPIVEPEVAKGIIKMSIHHEIAHCKMFEGSTEIHSYWIGDDVNADSHDELRADLYSILWAKENLPNWQDSVRGLVSMRRHGDSMFEFTYDYGYAMQDEVIAVLEGKRLVKPAIRVAVANPEKKKGWADSTESAE